ncbi:MAG: HD domain-containing protein [Bacteroidia bacterium]|nr:HD domain-containing protein [Bacteroidia bacterium]
MKNPFNKEVYLERRHAKDFGVRGDFFRDQTAIIHSMPFRRLKHKTQVFFDPENDHVCTRIEHVLHVATIAATICKGLNAFGWDMDIDMAYAIGLGHDLGHTPFGHAGESALQKKLGDKFCFMHELNSYRIVEYLSNHGKGLNLTFGVKDGIICHNGEKDDKYLKPADKPNDLDSIKNRCCMPSSYEGCVMRFSDKIAYLGRDIEDALIAEFIKKEDIPEDVRKELGSTNGEIINTLVADMIVYSADKEVIGFSDEKFELMTKLKKFNYTHIYNHPELERYNRFCHQIISNLFDHFSELHDKLKNDFKKYDESPIKTERAFGHYAESMHPFYENEKADTARIVTDYIAGMTDYYALESMKQITIPAPIAFRR